MLGKVVHYQTNDLDVGIMLFNKPLDLVGSIFLVIYFCIDIPVFTKGSLNRKMLETPLRMYSESSRSGFLRSIGMFFC